MNPARHINAHQGRHWSRRLALQALYQWQMAGQDLHEIETQFSEDENAPRSDFGYLLELLRGVAGRLDELDVSLSGHMDRSLEAVDPVERAILRVAAYELVYRPEVPYKVVINEAVDLAKRFGAEQGHRFVNGVLDKLAARLRPEETRRASG
jgi:N utilization substance protein B